jgi:hypothetical protein
MQIPSPARTVSVIFTAVSVKVKEDGLPAREIIKAGWIWNVVDEARARK